MDNFQSTIGMPVEQGFYTLILGIIPKGLESNPLYFYNPDDERVKYCTIYGVSLHESICDTIASCQIEIEVPYTWLDNQYFTDGTKISIQMKINEGISSDNDKYNENPYIYRLFNIEKIEDHGVFIRLSLYGVTDFLQGYGDGNSLNCSCTTSNVFNTCATNYGFSNTNIDSTNDKQLWIANGRTVYQFLTYCCQYGWVDDTSGMMWAIDRNKTLYYKNVVKCFNSGCSDQGCMNINIGSLGVPVITTIPFGQNNVELSAYGSDADTFVFGKKESCEYDYFSVDANDLLKTSESTCICKDCNCQSGQNWFPFNIGNHNEKYFRAMIQNKQVLSTYCTYLSVMFTPSTGVVAKNSIVPFFEAFHLFDTANLTYNVYVEDGKFTSMKALTSRCMIESIDVDITQAHAATKIKFVTQGLNTKNNQGNVN